MDRLIKYVNGVSCPRWFTNERRSDKGGGISRCKMQDNLEFLQWMKKYWDMHSRGEGYDAQARACVFPPSVIHTRTGHGLIFPDTAVAISPA